MKAIPQLHKCQELLLFRLGTSTIAFRLSFPPLFLPLLHLRHTFSLIQLHLSSSKLPVQTNLSNNGMHLSSFHLTEIHRSSFDSVYAFCWQSSITGKSSVSNADLKQLYIVGGQKEMYWFLSEETLHKERQLLNYLDMIYVLPKLAAVMIGAKLWNHALSHTHTHFV